MQKIKLLLILSLFGSFFIGGVDHASANCELCYGYVAWMASSFPSGQCYDVGSCQNRCSTLAASCAACNGTLDYMATNVSYCQNSFCQDNCESDPGDPGDPGDGGNTVPPGDPNGNGGRIPGLIPYSSPLSVSAMPQKIDKMYGYHPISFRDAGFQDCNEDYKGAALGKCVEISGSPTRGGQGCPSGPYFPPSNIKPGNVGGSMQCWFRDNERPWADAVPTEIARQNTAPVVTIHGRDDGGSGIGVGIGSTFYGIDWSRKETGKVRYIWSYSGTDCFNDPDSAQVLPSLIIPGQDYVANITMNREGSHYLYICVTDNAGRTNDHPLIFGPYRYDALSPLTGLQEMKVQDLAINTNLLAHTGSNNLKIIYDETNLNKIGCHIDNGMDDYNETSCAPLKTIKYRYESATGSDTYDPEFIQEVCEYPGYNCNKTRSWDMTLVDNDGNSADGKRVYDSRIFEICDDAGNCSTPKDFWWNIFANVPDWGNPQHTSYSDNFSSTSVADGDANIKGTAMIKDVFGNKLIPVVDIGRVVNFNFKYSNSTKLNQYKEPAEGGSAFFFNFEGQLKFTQSESDGNEHTYSQMCYPNGDPETCDNVGQIKNGVGIYNFWLMSFAPNSQYRYGIGNTSAIKLDSHIYDEGTVNRPGPINDSHVFLAESEKKSVGFVPLFYTNISGFPLISEGIGQQFEIKTSENGGKNKFNNTNEVLGIESAVKYDKSNQNINTFLSGGTVDPSTTLEEGSWISECLNAKKGSVVGDAFGQCSADAKMIKGTALSLGTGEFGAGYRLLQGAGVSFNGLNVGSITTHLAVKFKNTKLYHIDDGIVDVRWNSDRVGTTGKTGDNPGPVTSQSPVKILGMVASSNFEKKTSSNLSEFIGGIDKVGEVVKFNLNSAVHKKVSVLLRDISPVSSVSNIFTYNGAKYNGFNVIYVKSPSGGNVVINENIESTSSDKKTLLIVEDGNVVINGNIQQSSKSVLGIIVLGSASSGKGNVYVNNMVTNVESLIYADGSIVTFKDGDLNKTQETMSVDELNNQIYFKGVLRVNNTIGGSRIQGNPTCPYFVSSCNQTVAQKYDLSYLRRFFMTKKQDIDHNFTNGRMPYGSGYLAGKISCVINGANIKCTDQNSSLNNSLPINIPGTNTPIIGTNNPFGDKNATDITPYSLKDYLAPIVLEYDSKIKTLSVPIFDVGL